MIFQTGMFEPPQYQLLEQLRRFARRGGWDGRTVYIPPPGGEAGDTAWSEFASVINNT